MLSRLEFNKMDQKTIFTLGSGALFLLALAIGYLGLFAGPAILLPPVITSLGFLVIAAVLFALRTK